MIKTLFMVSFGNIRNKKKEAVLIGITVILASLLFAAALGLLGGMSKPVEAMFEKLQASQVVMLFDSRIHDPEKIVNWWSGKKGVQAVTPAMPAVATMQSPSHNGKELSALLWMVERDPSIANQDRIIMVEGDKTAEQPGHGQCWAATGFAFNNNIKVGDEIGIPVPNGMLSLKVSGIIVDPQFSSTTISPSRLWLAPGDLSYFYPAASITQVFVGIRFNDYSQKEELWKEFETSLGGAFGGFSLDYEIITMTYLVLYIIISTLLIFFSVLGLFTALFILVSAVNGAILAEYRTIGILKSQGLTPGNIIVVFLFQFGLISLAGIALGVTLAFPAANLLMNGFIRVLGLANYAFPMAGASLATALLFLSIILATIVFSSLKAARIPAVNAIRFGGPEEKKTSSKINLLKMDRLPLPVALGIKLLGRGKRQSFMTLATAALTVFVLASAINISLSLKQPENATKIWGFVNNDAEISRSRSRFNLHHNELMERLSLYPEIAGVLEYESIIENLPQSGDKASRSIVGYAFGENMDFLELENIEGRNPQGAGEISLALNTAKEWGAKPGSRFTLFMDGQPQEFTVSGIFQTVNNFGQSFRISSAKMLELNPLFEPSRYSVKLKPGADPKAFVIKIESELGGSIDAKTADEDLLRTTTNGVVSGMIAVLGMLSLLFLIVCFMTLSNSVALFIRENRKSLGIFKSLGMTPSEARISVIVRVAILCSVGLLAGLLPALLVAPALMLALFGSMGIVSFPMTIFWPGIAALSVFFLGFGVAAAWFSSADMKSIRSRELILE